MAGRPRWSVPVPTRVGRGLSPTGGPGSGDPAPHRGPPRRGLDTGLVLDGQSQFAAELEYGVDEGLVHGRDLAQLVVHAQPEVLADAERVVAEEVDPLDGGAQGGGEADARREIGGGVVPAGDHHEADPHGLPGLGEPPGVVQDAAAGHAGAPAVRVLVDGLDVVEEQVGAVDDPREVAPGDVPGGVDRGVDPLLLEAGQAL